MALPRLRGLLLALACALASGCSHREIEPDAEPPPDDLLDDTSETSTSSSQGIALGRLFFLPLTKDVLASPALAAAQFNKNAGALLALASGFPPKCVKVVPLPGESQVRLYFQGCVGPYGLLDVRGALDAEFVRREGASLKVRIASGPDLLLNGKPASYSADAFVSFDGNRRDLLWYASWQGESKSGRRISFDASFNILLDVSEASAKCIEVSGSTAGQIGERELLTTIDSYRACAGRCPERGVVSGAGKRSGQSVTLSFDGSPLARVTTSRGGAYTLPLACDP